VGLQKGADGSHQLRAATAPKLVAYLARPTTAPDDVVAFVLQFHRTLRDDKDPWLALAVFLQLLKQTYDAAGTAAADAGSGSGGGAAGAAVAVRVGAWAVLDRLLEARLNLFPDPTASPAGNGGGSGAAGNGGGERSEGGGDGDESESDEGEGEGSSGVPAASSEQLAAVRTWASCACHNSCPHRVHCITVNLQVRRSLRDLVASTVRSGLPDALAGGGGTNGATNPPRLDSVYR
jgi:hypothetical protein